MSHQDNIKALILTHNRRLQILKQQRAREGNSVDPKIIIEIEDIEEEIQKLEAKRNQLQKNTEKSLQLVKTDFENRSLSLSLNFAH